MEELYNNKRGFPDKMYYDDNTLRPKTLITNLRIYKCVYIDLWAFLLVAVSCPLHDALGRPTLDRRRPKWWPMWAQCRETTSLSISLSL